MGGFCRGISFAEEEAKSAGEITTKLPIAILTGEPENVYPVCYIPTARLIGVAQHYIEELSEFDQDAVLTFERVDGEIFFIGTPSEYFELCGIEEYSHGVDAFAGYNLSESNPLSMSMAKYDSQDHEFKALGRQVKYAKQNGFHQEAIQILEQRQKAAIQYRGKEVKK